MLKQVNAEIRVIFGLYSSIVLLRILFPYFF